MKTNRILLLLFLLAIGACAQKPPVTTGAVPQGVEDQLFVAGEAQFAAGDYPAALASYQA
ncbi:MAG: hypothetical protein JRE62_09995, partial [Deltaproteobacteria bacterium]|nr:hypothetical protein [Deltaproteobacteria bacterium]